MELSGWKSEQWFTHTKAKKTLKGVCPLFIPFSKLKVEVLWYLIKQCMQSKCSLKVRVTQRPHIICQVLVMILLVLLHSIIFIVNFNTITCNLFSQQTFMKYQEFMRVLHTIRKMSIHEEILVKGDYVFVFGYPFIKLINQYNNFYCPPTPVLTKHPPGTM